MSQKAMEKTRAGASTLVPAGETVRHAVPVQIGPYVAVMLGPLGLAFTRFRTVAVSDEALYVMTKNAMGGTPKGVEKRTPLGSVTVSTKKGPGLVTRLVVGNQKMFVVLKFREEAAKLVAAASVRSPAVTR